MRLKTKDGYVHKIGLAMHCQALFFACHPSLLPLTFFFIAIASIGNFNKLMLVD